jgi:hypothetical protein
LPDKTTQASGHSSVAKRYGFHHKHHCYFDQKKFSLPSVEFFVAKILLEHLLYLANAGRASYQYDVVDITLAHTRLVTLTVSII